VRHITTRKSLAALFIAGLWILPLALINQEYGLASLLDPVGLIAVLVPLIAVVVVTKKNDFQLWPSIFLAIGVPLGLLAAVAGFIWHLGTQGLTGDYARVYPMTGNMLTTVLYGGVASAVGYFARKSIESEDRRVVLTRAQGLFLSALVVGLFLLMFGMDGLMLIWEPSALAILVSCVCTAGLINPLSRLASAAEATIFASLFLVVLGVIYFYFSDAEKIEPLMLTTVGLTYGIVAYLLLYFASLVYQAPFVNVSSANWHWLELCAFLIFMLYAPQTIREIQQNASEESVIEQREVEQ